MRLLTEGFAMRENIELSESECKENLNKFYSYFENGYKFEDFLKAYLAKIGLEEIVVTRRSGDGGIDLTAVRKGVGGLSNSIDQPYFIQAKRYAPGRCVSPGLIRALRGSFTCGTGMFITTGKVSGQAQEEARNLDPSKPVIVIEGEELVRSCIDNGIGFVFKPVFSKEALDQIMGEGIQSEIEPPFETVRSVTESDIRTYIFVLPRAIREMLPEDASTIDIQFGASECKTYNLSADKRYIGGISEVYRQFGLRRPDGVFIPREAVWTKRPDGKFKVDFR